MREKRARSQAYASRTPGDHYEYLEISLAPREKLAQARARLAEHAEYGKWELVRSTHLYGGQRKYWMRRRITRVERTA